MPAISLIWYIKIQNGVTETHFWAMPSHNANNNRCYVKVNTF